LHVAQIQIGHHRILHDLLDRFGLIAWIKPFNNPAHNLVGGENLIRKYFIFHHFSPYQRFLSSPPRSSPSFRPTTYGKAGQIPIITAPPPPERSVSNEVRHEKCVHRIADTKPVAMLGASQSEFCGMASCCGFRV
ncbi:MAG: hypothetical protein ORN49_04030, partial [Rhodobacteraceae bacterium]|nr:hypothetical protein [Paracoccaceae bacterium]